MLLICVCICLITNTFSKPLRNEARFSQAKDVSLVIAEHHVISTPNTHASKIGYDVDCSDTSCEWVKEHPCHGLHYSKSHLHGIHGQDDHLHSFLDQCCENGAFSYTDCVNGQKFPVVLHPHEQHHHRAIHHHFQHGTHETSHVGTGGHNEFLRVWHDNTYQSGNHHPFTHQNQSISHDMVHTSYHTNAHPVYHTNAHPVPLHVFGKLHHGIVDAPYPEHVLDGSMHTVVPKNGSSYADVAAQLTDVPVTVPTATHTDAATLWPNSLANVHPLPWRTGEGPTNADVLNSLANVNVRVVAPFGAHTNSAPLLPINSAQVGAAPSYASVQANGVPSLPNVVATAPIGTQVNTAPVSPVNVAADGGLTSAYTNAAATVPIGSQVNTAHVNPVNVAADAGALSAYTNAAGTVPVSNQVNTAPISPVNVATDAGVSPAHTNVGLGGPGAHASVADMDFTVPVTAQANTGAITPNEVSIAPSQTTITDEDVLPAPAAVPIQTNANRIPVRRPLNATYDSVVTPSHTRIGPTNANALTGQTDLNRNINLLCGNTRIMLTRAVIVQEGINPADKAAVLQRFCSASVPVRVGENAGIIPARPNTGRYVANVPLRGNVSTDTDTVAAPYNTAPNTARLVTTSANVKPAHVTAPSQTGVVTTHAAEVPLNAETQDTDTDDDIPIQGIELSTDAEKSDADIQNVVSPAQKKVAVTHKRLHASPSRKTNSD